MYFSKIAMNRMLEGEVDHVKFSKAVPENKRKTVLKDIRNLEDKTIVSKLNGLGVQMEKASFSEEIRKYPSAEEYCIRLMEAKKLRLGETDKDLLWMCLTVLWERWFPEIRNFEMIDDKIDSGYMLSAEREEREACNLWWDAWEDIIYLMDQHSISGINAFDDRFGGTQSVYNWASDFDMELHNAGLNDESYTQKRIEFCSEYIKRSEDKKDHNIENMKRAVAESYIDIGRQEEGDTLFEGYLQEDPEWGWGWIGWSDCYWIFPVSPHINYEKAEAILKKALTVPGLRDREDVMERLLQFYDETDRKEEADEIERQLKALIKSKPSGKNNIPAASSVKTGRNDPCPCGSGKKYKKFCGK